MPQTLLQVNMRFDIPRAELEAAWLQAAQPIAETPGLRWKVWLMNETDREAGGIYLFDSEEAAQGYLDGPIVAEFKTLGPAHAPPKRGARVSTYLVEWYKWYRSWWS